MKYKVGDRVYDGARNNTGIIKAIDSKSCCPYGCEMDKKDWNNSQFKRSK